MLRLIVETALHTVLLPGAVVVGLPYLVLSSSVGRSSFSSVPLRIASGVLLVAGVALGLWCTRHFIVLGHGTPNPLDPPKFLVRAGPYQVVRNPMYVAVGAILAGEALFFGSAAMLVYLVVVMTFAHLFVTLHEEPTLHRLFDGPYDDYRRRVPRWLPRRK